MHDYMQSKTDGKLISTMFIQAFYILYNYGLFSWCIAFTSYTPAEKFINVLVYNQSVHYSPSVLSGCLLIGLLLFIHLLLIKQSCTFILTNIFKDVI